MNALAQLSAALTREGFEPFYADDKQCYLRHVVTNTIAVAHPNPHRPFSAAEQARRQQLEAYLQKCSEDDLIEHVLLPLFRQMGFHRVTAAGHKDKALEYGKDVWMKYALPTQHALYFGIQAKKGKLDAAGMTKGDHSNIAEIHNQVTMMLGTRSSTRRLASECSLTMRSSSPEERLRTLIVPLYVVRLVRTMSTQRHEAEKRAQALAQAVRFDKLTGALSRAGFDDAIRALQELGKKTGEHIGLVYLDLDGFKAINDTNGHDRGDAVLKEVATSLARMVRASDSIARLGGDEFVIVVKGPVSEEDVGRVAHKAVESIRCLATQVTGGLPLDASAGIAVLRPGWFTERSAHGGRHANV